MTGRSDRIDSILYAAVELATPEERAAYVRRQCAGDEELQVQIEELLAAYLRAGDFLESPSPAMSPTINMDAKEGPGATIGRYKLLEQIGEGGFGVVFMAEQVEPVRRRVALKIIKVGMDTRQVVARFEAERQALALMDHPNIARVLDAGESASGRPYFVMELVKGVPITDYCDAQRLSVRQRLQLISAVCHGVQHAHHKGVIHRDLKPNNVLVAEYDGRAAPRIIDFGVAKAIGQQLAERTLFTQFGQIIGTLEYMSPEQAQFNQLDVDTRSDVYSLGVLLYELLAGSTPLEKERLRAAAFDQILHMISAEEPPKPSARLSSSQSLPSIAANRSLNPDKLAGLVRGDLDWIVMKALDKDRSRRYETANGLAQDIEHFLADEPVLARPPSAAYRLNKFVRRHKLPFAAGLALALALLAGLGLSSWMYLKEKAARERAHAAEERSAKALTLIKSIIWGDGASPGIQDPKLLQEVLPGLGLEEATITSAGALNNLALELRKRGRYDDAVALLRRAQDIYRKIYDGDNEEIVATLNNLALTLWDQRKLDEAEQTSRQALAMARRLWGPDAWQVAKQLNDLGGILKDQGHLQEAEGSLEQSLAIRKRQWGDKHFETAESTFHLAEVSRSRGNLEKAARLYREALQTFRELPSAGDAPVVGVLLELATTLLDSGDFAEAEKCARESLDIYKRTDPQNSTWQPFYAHSVLAEALARQKNYADAELQLKTAYEGMQSQRALVPNRYYREVLERLADYYEAVGQADRVAQWKGALAAFDESLNAKPNGVSKP